MNNFKKLVFKSSNISTVPICPSRVLVIQVCNENSVKDDNFDVYLNDTYIGYLDLNYDLQVGSVFISNTNTNVQLTSSDFACPLDLMVKYHFTPDLLVFGQNKINLVNAQSNGNGSQGTIGIRSYELIGNNLSNPCFIANLTYNSESGISFENFFNYTSCCAE